MFIKKFRLITIILCVFLTIGYFAVNTGAVSTVLLAIQGAITDGNLVKFSGTNGIGVDAGLSATNVVKCKFDATSAPTINNDVDEGYTVGSSWLDVTNDKSYVCLDNSDGAAVWTETTGPGGGATTFLGLTDTPAAYTGQAGKYTKVNAGETALEFGTPTGGGTVTTSGNPIVNDIARFTAATVIEGLSYAEFKVALDLEIGTDIQAYDAGLLSLAGLIYVSPSFVKVTASDTYAIRTFAEVKADLDLEIGTDILAFQAIGIADDNLVELDDLDAAINDYCKLTANGIVGRSYAEVKTDLGIDLSLYYLKTEIDSLSKLETIYTKNIIDSDELAALKFTDLDDTPANYTGQAGKYVKVNAGETDLEFETPAGGGTYLELIDTPAAYDNGKYAKSTADGVIWDDPAGAGDMLKATYDTDADSDIDVSAGGTEKSSWTLYCIPYLSGTTAFGEIPIGTVGQVLKVGAGATGYEFANESDPTVDTDAEIKAILVDEVIKTGTLTVGNLTKTNNATGVVEDAGVATETTLTTDSDTKIPTSKAINTFCETTKGYKGKNYYSALGSDHTYSDNADTDSQPVGESVAFGDLLYFNWTDKEWKKTDADTAATMPGLRIALETKIDGQTCLMLVKGYIRDDSAFEFTGAMVYTSVTPGAMSSTAPTETDDQLQRVGVAKSADILFFDPSIDVGEIKP